MCLLTISVKNTLPEVVKLVKIAINRQVQTSCICGIFIATHTKARIQIYKEVFVKHEQAPTAPKLEGVWVFVDFKYIFYENRYFWPIIQLPVGCF